MKVFEEDLIIYEPERDLIIWRLKIPINRNTWFFVDAN